VTKYEIVKDDGAPRIEAVEVVKENEEHVFIAKGKGWTRRRKGDGIFRLYHDTWLEARAHLLALAEKRLETNRKSLEAAKAFLADVVALEPPADIFPGKTS